MRYRLEMVSELSNLVFSSVLDNRFISEKSLKSKMMQLIGYSLLKENVFYEASKF